MSVTPGARQSLRDTHPVAVLARLALIGAVAAVLVATTFRAPHLLYSYNLEHFAAFYVLALLAALAKPRTRLRRLTVAVVLFAFVTEGVRLAWKQPLTAVNYWCADVGGLMAAYVPILVERLRRRFRPQPAAPMEGP